MKLKKALAATLAATMVMSSAITVCATGYESSESSAEETTYVAASAPVAVAGTTVTTTVAGTSAATTVQGTAVTTPKEEIAAVFNLEDGTAPAITVYDTDPAKSPAALACVDAALAALSPTAEAVATLNIDLYAKEENNPNRIELPNGSVAMVAGLPADADLTKEYVVICVQPGGKVTILEDLDPSPKTVTFEVQSGIGTYAIAAQ